MAVLVVGRLLLSREALGGFPYTASIRTIGGRTHYFRSIANQNATWARGCCSGSRVWGLFTSGSLATALTLTDAVALKVAGL
jgi:hypothetical protein